MKIGNGFVLAVAVLVAGPGAHAGKKKKGPEKPDKDTTALFQAVEERNVQVVRAILEQFKPNTNFRRKVEESPACCSITRHETPLIAAIRSLKDRSASLEIVKLLLANGANPNIVGPVLHYRGAGAAPGGPWTTWAEWPLGAAIARHGDFELAELLLKAGASPNLKVPMQSKSPSLARVMLESYASGIMGKKAARKPPPEARPIYAHRWKMKSDHLKFWKLLLEHGLDTKEDGFLMAALSGPNSREDANELSVLLVKSGADPNSADSSGNGLLHRAAGAEDGRVAALLELGVSPRATNGRGVTPLHIAADAGSAGNVKLLLAKGASVDARDRHGRTPLFAALKRSRVDVAIALLDGGANPNLADESGGAPMDLAVKTGSRGLMSRLRKAGAKETPNTIGRLMDSSDQPVAAPEGSGEGSASKTESNGGRPVFAGRTWIERRGWRVVVALDDRADASGHYSGRIKYNKFKCTGTIYKGRDTGDGFYTFRQKLSGRCTPGCQFKLSTDGTRYEEHCKGRRTGGGTLKAKP